MARDIREGGKYNITASIRNETAAPVTVHADCVVVGTGGTEALDTRTVAIEAGGTANVKFNDTSTLGKGDYGATVTVAEDASATGSDTFRIK